MPPTRPVVLTSPLPPAAPAPAARLEGVRRRYRPAWWRRLWAWFEASPWFGMAAVAHGVVLLVLSLLAVATPGRPPPEPVAAKLLVERELDLTDHRAELDSPDLEPLIDAAEEDRSEEPPEAPTDHPFEEAFGETEGPDVDAVAVFGTGPVGGTKGRGRGGQRRGGARRGASSASEAALDGGLAWLARHQAGDGGWNSLPDDHARTGGLPPTGNTGRTALALLCFLAAGHAPNADGPYREAIGRGRAWLVRGQRDDGTWRRHRGGMSRMYEQALGTLALAECLAREDQPDVRRAVERGVRFLVAAQSDEGGWRYKPRQGSDTSVTSWCVLALKSAEHAGVHVDYRALILVREYLETVSREWGATKYMARAGSNPAMNATGLFLRLVLGEAPTTERNRAAARLVARECVPGHGAGRRDRSPTDYYAIYYGALALYQVGGEVWEDYNRVVRDGVVALQRGPRRGCAEGSWAGADRLDEPILATTFAVLILETYYRYLRVHGSDPGADAPEPIEVGPTPGEEAFDAAAAALTSARAEGDPAGFAAAEAAWLKAQALLEREDRPETPFLLAEARARLVETAARTGDDDLALERAEAYVRRLPAGERPDGGVLRIRRLGRVRVVMGAVERALASPEPGPRTAALREVDGLLRFLRAEAARVTTEAGRREVGELVAHAERVRLQLGMATDPDGSLEATWAEVAATPARGEPGPLERQVVGQLHLAAARAYEAVAGGDPLRWAEAERSRGRIAARRLEARLSADDRAALRPLALALELARLKALFALERFAEVGQRAPAFRDRFGEGAALGAVDRLERTALLRRLRAGAAGPAERRRLVALLRTWGQAQLEPPALRTLADALLDLGERKAARARYAELAACREAGDGDLAHARLLLARLDREAGDPDAAAGHLDALPPSARDRFDALLERGLVLRAQDDPEAALDLYLPALRSLAAAKPAPWWEVAEAVVRTYVEADQVARARDLLEQLREDDAEFGDDPERSERLRQLMVDLDRG